MPDLTETIFHELRALPPRRGLFAEDLPRRIGPVLREMAGIAADDDELTCREKLVDCLDRLLSTVPAPERQVISIGIGLDLETKDRSSLALRLRWLEMHEERDARTVRRWLERALHRLARSAARQITEGDAAPDTGWYVESLRALLRLDLPAPVASEDRRIVATRHGLRELTHRVSLPRADDLAGGADRGLEVDLDFGGRLRLDQATDTDFRYVVALGRPLDWGDRHDLRITARLPPGTPMSPHYTCVPQRRYDMFELRVRFDPDRLPRQVRRIDGGSPRSGEARTVTGDVLVPDAGGEVRTEFRRLRQGFSYGMRWTES